MTQIYITIGLITVIALLVCFVFIRQTIGERKRERDRLQRVLVKRAKDLTQMVSAFPENFLPNELVVFIYRCIIDAYEQLTKLVPEDNNYLDELKMHSAQLEAVVRTPDKKQTVDMQSTTQINELRQYLNLLGKFLQKSMERQHISSKQHAHYKTLLKELIVKLAVNNYKITAQQAANNGQTKLAIHYYDLAKKLLMRDTPTDYSDQIAHIEESEKPLLAIEAQTKEAERTKQAEEQENSSDDPQGKSEWSDFEEDAGWQKKNVYD